jgi:hypothetical protein
MNIHVPLSAPKPAAISMAVRPQPGQARLRTWVEARGVARKAPSRIDDSYAPTIAARRQSPRHLVPMRAVAVIAAVALAAIPGMTMGLYLATSGARGRTTASEAISSAVRRAQPGAVRVVATPAARGGVRRAPPPGGMLHEVPGAVAPAKLVEIRIDSDPPGATVTRAVGGALLGTTPITAYLDPSHGHDLVFALPGHREHHEHLEPRGPEHLSVVFEGDPEVAAAGRRGTPSTAGAASGSGTLAVSSWPRCTILVDGIPTGLTTPQRALALPAGAHQITLRNGRRHVDRIITVQIKRGRSTKLVRDFRR